MKVAIAGDTAVETDEIQCDAVEPSGATISRATATGTIRNDDVALPTVSIADAAKAEGGSGTSNLGFTVTLSKAATSTVTVKYATSNGTATAGQDYTAGSGTVTFFAGQQSKTVNVAVNGDTAVEADETFTVTLSESIRSHHLACDRDGHHRQRRRLNAADARPLIAIGDANITGVTAASPMAFTVSLSSASSMRSPSIT